jgi:hypothetical protein
MRRALVFKLAPVAVFILAGIAFAARVVITPAKCLYDGSCGPAPANHSCVDTTGDGTCDYTSIPWEPV